MTEGLSLLRNILMSQELQIKRLQSLFQGNSRVIGQTSSDLIADKDNPAKLKQSDVYWSQGPSTTEHWKNHLDGKIGLGLVPITDYQEVKFMVIDVDLPMLEALKLSLTSIVVMVEEKKLPFIVCRSKSGAAHIYIFFSQLTEAAAVRNHLVLITEHLGFRDLKGNLAEIYPHTSQLDPTSNGKFINLPYFRGNERTAIDSTGHPISLDDFLFLAESRITNKARFLKWQVPVEGEDFIRAIVDNGPPCLQTLFNQGLTEGMRNDMLFQFGILFKKAHKERFEDLTDWVNQNKTTSPIATSELGQLMKGIRRKDYHYSCNHPCMAPICAKIMCQGRKFGIRSNIEFPPIAKLIQWGISNDNFEVHFDTDNKEVLLIRAVDLLDFEKVQAEILRLFHVVVPPIKKGQWVEFVTTLMTKAKREEVPMEFTTESQIKSLILSFTVSRSMGTKPDDLLVHKPIRDGEFVLISFKDLQSEIHKRKYHDYTEGLELPVIYNELKGEFATVIASNGEKIGVIKIPMPEDHSKEILDNVAVNFKPSY